MSTSTLNAGASPAAALEHGLAPYLPEFARYPSFGRLERSPLYRTLRPEIERVLGSVVFENLSSGGHEPRSSIRATAWNIERGIQLAGILRALEEHPRLQNSDLLLLTELDFGMARTHNRFIAREIALRAVLSGPEQGKRPGESSAGEEHLRPARKRALVALPAPERAFSGPAQREGQDAGERKAPGVPKGRDRRR